MTLSVVLSHARHFTECEQYITHSATSMSLSLSRAFFHWKTKRTPKDEWRLESSFLHVPLRPSVYPSSQSLFSSSFFLCFSAKSHIDDHSFPANGGSRGGLMPDMSCERAENSLSQNTRGIQRFFSQNGGIDLRDMLTHDGRNFSGARLR